MRLPVIKVFHRLDLKGMPPPSERGFFCTHRISRGDSTYAQHSWPCVLLSNCAIVQLCNCAIWKSKMYSFKYIIILILLYIIIYNNIKLLLMRFLIVFNLAIAQIAFAQIASAKCICKTECVSLWVWIVLNNLSSHCMREKSAISLYFIDFLLA